MEQVNLMSYLSFVHGHCTFAVSVDQVQYIVAENQIKKSTVAGDGTAPKAVFRFEDELCHVVDMDVVAQTESEFAHNEELIDLFNAREKDHVDWVNALKESLIGGVDFTKPKDPHQCKFGQWYDNFKSNDDYLNHIMERFNAPHKRIHALAGELLGLRDEGKTEEAMDRLAYHERTTLVQLRKTFDDARNIVTNLVRPTVIILRTEDHHLVALKVDHIGQVLDVENANIQHREGTAVDMPEYAVAMIKEMDAFGDGNVETSILLDAKRLTNFTH
jgi:chemotaxis signal transduction protein